MSTTWKPHPGMQENACRRWEFEVFLGGAAGPGKTDVIVMEALRYIHFPTYRAVILRRTYPELEEIVDRTKEWYPAFGGEYRETKHRWGFPSGASIKLSHMQHEDDKRKHQGKEYQYIGFDEATHFTPTQYLYLFSRARTKDRRIPVRVRAASNPGGVGHSFFKDRFKIGHVKPGTTIYDTRTGLSRVFIPGLLEDNPTLLENDPTYVQRLEQLPEIEKLRLRHGVWDAFEGQAFAELSPAVHGFEGELPEEWEAFGAFDWGYAKPWAYGIWRTDYDGRIWLDKLAYGLKTDTEDTGVRMTDEEIAREIRKLEEGVRVRFRIADPSIFHNNRLRDGVRGPAVSEGMSREGVHFVKGDNNRVYGWQQLHYRMRCDEEGKPWIYIRRSLSEVWKTLGMMREDPNNPEDLITKEVPDHIPDMVRYACMHKPIRPKLKTASDKGSFQYERRQYLKAKQLSKRQGITLEQAYQQRY